jgi:hypothetical protein
VAVVADQDDGAAIVVERLDQGLAGVDVEMVGRLVEDEQCGASRVISASASRARSPPDMLATGITALTPEKPKRPSWARTAAGVALGISRLICWSGVSSPCSSST